MDTINAFLSSIDGATQNYISNVITLLACKERPSVPGTIISFSGRAVSAGGGGAGR